MNMWPSSPVEVLVIGNIVVIENVDRELNVVDFRLLLLLLAPCVEEAVAVDCVVEVSALLSDDDELSVCSVTFEELLNSI